MSQTAIVVLAVAAVLLFWTVGAYNRLVGLRNAIIAAFTPLDDQFRQRHLLLRKQGEQLVEQAVDPALLASLDAALSQVDAACAHARMRPGALGAIASLRLAEETLASTRARLPAEVLALADLADLQARLAASEASLDFTRRRFNETVSDYNAAVRQFPTWIIAALFGFQAAGHV